MGSYAYERKWTLMMYLTSEGAGRSKERVSALFEVHDVGRMKIRIYMAMVNYPAQSAGRLKATAESTSG